VHEAVGGDELGVSALPQAPGQLDDGTRLDYAWATLADAMIEELTA